MTGTKRAWVLVASPLVGSVTWAPVRAALDERGVPAVVAALGDDGRSPFWRQHVDAIAKAVERLDPTDDVVLAGHSGAGPLLAAAAATLGRRVAALVFVDAGLPRDEATRLDLLHDELPDVAATFAADLAAGGRYPTWSDADLSDEIPDPDTRAAVVAELQPRGQDFFTETIPAPPGWDELPCAYLQLSVGYDQPAATARARGWPVTDLQGRHFSLVTEPERVATALLELVTLASVRFDDRGLVPAIVQQHDSGEVLMLAWMTADTLRDTMASGETVFWSRSRAQRWHKGATSGNTQRVVEVVADCDGDTLLVKVDQHGTGACHTGARSCFHRPL